MPKTTICKEYTILGLYFGYAAVTLIFGLTVTLFDVLYILFLHSVVNIMVYSLSLYFNKYSGGSWGTLTISVDVI